MNKYKIDNNYNVIRLTELGGYDYYLQKNGYGNLLYMFGLCEPLTIAELKELASVYINTYSDFWAET